MSYKQMDQRLARLEEQAPPDGEHRYAADIASDEPHYWIDDREVSRAEFMHRAPAAYIVDLGDDE